MKPIVVVAIRSDINWLEMDKNKFFAQGNTPITKKIFTKNWLSKHWQYIEFWNSILNEEYFHLRHRFQKFSEKTHDNIHGVDLVIKGKDSILKFIRKYKNDKWIMLPIDDDDFFRPLVVAKLLESYDSKYSELITWRTILFNTSLDSMQVKLINQDSVFPSNSYMINNRLVKKVHGSVLNEIISRHASVKKKIKKHGLKCTHLDDDLSLYNKSPVSFSGTRGKKMDRSVIGDYFSSVRFAINNEINYNGYYWVRPYANNIQTILRDCFK